MDIPQIKLDPESNVEPAPKAAESIMHPIAESGSVSLPKFKVPRNKKRIYRIVAITGGVALVLLLLVVLLVVLPGINLYKNAKVLGARVQRIKEVSSAQDLGQIKSELAGMKTDLANFEKSFKGFVWSKPLPLVGAYYRDGESALKAAHYGMETGDLLIETIEPYADIIGLKGGKQASSGMDNANDRLEFIVSTIKDITPKMGVISQKASLAHDELVKIDPNRYPVEFRGMKVREQISQLLGLAQQGTEMIAESKPLIEAAPYILGVDEPRTYLLLFQNDKELRPTGGFITAYSIMKVSKGKIESVSSSDIYSLDSHYKPVIAGPEPFKTYLKGEYVASNRFKLRDMNWSPDFKESMDMFLPEAQKAGIKNIDGIIAVDTQVVVNILNAIGQVGVFGFGNFNTNPDPRCNCPQVIYELENFADVEGAVVWSENEPGKIVFAPKNYGKNRKEIVGPLMNSILANALGQPKDKLPALFTAGWDSLINKHVLMYMLDEKAQAGVESFKIAGRILDAKQDYLHVNDANLGGRKSNLYVTQEMTQEYKVARDGTIEKTLTLTYKNPQKYDGWLNSVLPNWTRIYVPKGSVLLDVQGFEDKGETTEEFGKTVFSGGFQLRPEGVKQIIVKYKLPFKASGSLNLLMQKQPGTDGPLVSIKSGRFSEEMYLKSDATITVGL